MTGEQLFKASGLSGEYDTAIPQQVFNTILDALGFNPLGHFVWWYPERDDEEYETCGSGGKLLPVKTMYDLAIKKRKLILIEEKYALVNHLVTDVDRDIVLASELEQMSQEKAFYGR
jgi:hypothetical protein